MGLGKAGQSQMQRGMEKARAAAYSDDEYNDLSDFQRRKRKGPRSEADFSDMGDESDYGMGQKDKNAQREFWDKVNNKDSTRSRRERIYNEEQKRKIFEQRVFEEFDEFFNMHEDQEVTRDDTVGADVREEIEIEFIEGINGCEREIVIDKRVTCVACKGRRADTSQKPRRCFECGGRGSIIGNYGIRKKCPKCEGSGTQIKNYCETCEGIGV